MSLIFDIYNLFKRTFQFTFSKYPLTVEKIPVLYIF